MFEQVLELTVFPQFAAFTQEATLGGRRYRLDFEWRPRLEAWFVSVINPSTQEYVFRGKRLTPSSSASGGNLGFENGAELLVTGPDPYTRYDLGTNLRVFYVKRIE